ncbi:MAG: hypothetical protein R2769_07240 [Saprospiraceae bacterium]
MRLAIHKWRVQVSVIKLSSIRSTLDPDEVMVIGGADLSAYMSNNAHGVQFVSNSFQFNGDDALELVYGGTQVDVFGIIGVDQVQPGLVEVSTADQNIALMSSINTGSTGFSDLVRIFYHFLKPCR